MVMFSTLLDVYITWLMQTVSSSLDNAISLTS